MAEINYKTNNEKMNDYSVIPAGDYIMHIKSDELKKTKTINPETGKPVNMLVLLLEILDGTLAGRIHFVNLNLWNLNSQARAIAQGEMNSICMACGFPEGVMNSEKLHRKAMLVKVGVRQKKDENKKLIPNEFENYIKKYSSLSNNQPNQAQPTPEQNEKETPKPWA